MPVKINKVGPGKFKVSTPSGTKAKATSKRKALAQKRIINQADSGRPVRRGRRGR